jgi:dynein heavy chain
VTFCAKVVLVLEAWQQVQLRWTYLQPIFASPDIARQMPTEGRKFDSVDAAWRSTITQLLQAGQGKGPRVLELTDSHGLLLKLRKCLTTLEDIQRGLQSYLETKRVTCPRFYFLSNDGLIEILSQVPPHFFGVTESQLICPCVFVFDRQKTLEQCNLT